MTYRDRHEADGTLGSVCRSIVTVFLRLAHVAQSLMGLLAANDQYGWRQKAICNSLEGIESLLPPTVALDPNLDTPEDHLLSAAEVYSELDDVAILDLEGLAFRVGLA